MKVRVIFTFECKEEDDYIAKADELITSARERNESIDQYADVEIIGNDLIYGIVCNGSVIAMFMNTVDRDDVLSFLADRYDDCKFTEFNKAE
jgi:hypothetical protein